MKIPLLIQTETRDGTDNKDARLINAYLEHTAEGADIVKRSGSSIAYTYTGYTGGGSPAGLARGIFQSSFSTKLLSVVNGDVFGNAARIGGLSSVGHEQVTFADLNGGLFTGTVFQDQLLVYTTTGTSVTPISPGGPVGPFVPGIAIVDGWVCVMDFFGNIQNSNLNDPTIWNPLNVIKADISQGFGIALTRHLNYVMALKETSVEFFYDAGNPVGSPFGLVEGAQMDIGCWNGNTVQDLNGAKFWLGRTEDSGACVMHLVGMQAQRVSTPFIEKILERVITLYGNEATFGAFMSSFAFRNSGHDFYGITIRSEVTLSAGITLVYDATTKSWAEWQLNGSYYPYVYTAKTNEFTLYGQNINGLTISSISPTVYQDNTVNLTVDFRTPKLSFDTLDTKFMDKIQFYADQVTSTATVQFSNDDYQTWSTARAIDLSKPDIYLTRCGKFRRRAMWVQHTDNTPFRMSAVDVELEKGS